jgi:hypothetical protein
MKHALFSQSLDVHVRWFEKFDKQAIKTAIVEHLKQYPDDVLEHCKDYPKGEVGCGMEIINFYQNFNNKPCRLIIKGNREYYKPLTVD